MATTKPMPTDRLLTLDEFRLYPELYGATQPIQENVFLYPLYMDYLLKAEAKDFLAAFAEYRAVSGRFSAVWYEMAKKYGVEVQD